MVRLARFVGVLVALSCAVALLLGGLARLDRHRYDQRMDREAQLIGAQPFYRDSSPSLVVVTGSSTVRLWTDSAAAFPTAQVVNTGFGGSTMDELADHYQELIGRYHPDEIYIGSGDNDLAFGRSRADILADADRLLTNIATELPDAQVAIVAAKPSLKRWYLRANYRDLNEGLRQLAASRNNVVFVDVWTRLLDHNGRVRPELYAEDGLHLNDRGYRIYAAALSAAQVRARDRA